MDVLHETALKERLRRRGVAVPSGGVACTVERAGSLADACGYPVVVKAVIGTGHRLRQGLVMGAADRAGVRAAAQRLLAVDDVDTVRVETEAPAGRELYLAFTFDFVSGHAVGLWGDGGTGVDVSALNRLSCDLQAGGEWTALPDALRPVADALFAEFVALGARLVELNPVRIVDGSAVVLDAKAVLDPFRPSPGDATRLGGASDGPGEELRKRVLARAATCGSARLRYDPLDGDVGLVMWGGGSTMIVLDAMWRLGLRPANYSDIAGGTGLERVIRVVAEAVVAQPVRGLFVGSTVSSVLSALEIGRAVHDLLQDCGRPVAVRVAGASEAGARAVFATSPNVRYFGRESTLEQAVAWLAAAIGSQ